MLKLYILIVAGPWLLGRIIKHRHDWKSANPPEYRPETDIERQLAMQQSDRRVRAAWQEVQAERARSEDNPRWVTPEEVLPEERIQRNNGMWQPTIPGVVFEKE